MGASPVEWAPIPRHGERRGVNSGSVASGVEPSGRRMVRDQNSMDSAQHADGGP
jgi:hypothetical protein